MRWNVALLAALPLAFPAHAGQREADIARVLAADRARAEQSMLDECLRADLDNDLAKLLGQKAKDAVNGPVPAPDDREAAARLMETLAKWDDAQKAAATSQAKCDAAVDRFRRAEAKR